MKNNQFILVSVFLSILTSCQPSGTTWKTDSLELRVNDSGYVDKLADLSTGQNYSVSKQPSPLLQVRKNGIYHLPTDFTETGQAGEYIVSFENTETQIKIGVQMNNTYVKLTILQVLQPQDLELVVWGPYHNQITAIIGEIVGVVRDDQFALGIQALNIRTLGGFPDFENDQDKAYDIFESNSVVDVADSVKVLYRGQTAKRTSNGSVLQAYVRDRSKTRIVPNWNHDKYVAPAFEDEGISGSSIAIFGCKPGKALETIGQIEVAEDLPHPVLDGKWAKTQNASTASYLIMNFGEQSLPEALKLTNDAGLKYLYHGGPFENWGHFDLNKKEFPDNWESMKRCVQIAEKEGIFLGVHTLSNFISTNDPYVTPLPHPGLAKVGTSTLSGDIKENDQNIPINEPDFFNQMKNNTLHAVVVNDEIIRYRQVSEQAPWMLLDCERGAFGTTRKPHQKGDRIAKLMDHGYQTFLTDAGLSKEVALRLADLFNQTGLRQISFDGLEGNWSTGMGQYGRQLFVQYWYDALTPELKGKIITDASNPGHFFWHLFTRMNWGEPWYAGFRESQTQYRLLNQDFYRRNLMPSMLGWFRMTPEISLEDIEWLLARAAGFDAGFALVTSLQTIKQHGLGQKIIQTIRIWEEARMAGAFPNELKQGLQDVDQEFHLEANGPNSYNLYIAKLEKATYTNLVKQPGEPNVLKIAFKNEYPDQPVSFVLSAPEETGLSAIQLEIDQFRRILLPLDLPAKHHLKYSGGSYIELFDSEWNKMEQARVIQDHLTLTQGDHSLTIEGVFTGSSGSIKAEFRTLSLPEILFNPSKKSE